MKKYTILILITTLILTSCTSQLDDSVFTENNINYISKLENKNLKIYSDSQWEKINIKAVKLDGEKPGLNTSLSEEDYFLWIEDIADMNANTIQVDSLFPPEFYRALKNYNEKNDNNIFLIQSIPMDKINFEKNPDPYKLDNIIPYKDRISTTISAIHGDVTIPNLEKQKNNLAHGNYDSNVAQYLLAFILEPDLNPDIIKFTNDNRQDKKDFDGLFVRTQNAKPFESFIADLIDHTINYEVENYSWARPVSFLNTINYKEDIYQNAGDENEPIRKYTNVNPNNINFKDKLFDSFISYELHPEQLEFLNSEEIYNKFLDHKGNTNNISAFLSDFIPLHDNPIFISSYGFPSSRNISHVNTSNFNKGFLSEEKQGKLLAYLYEEFIYQSTLGASINSWIDNWTLDSDKSIQTDNINRRKLWADKQNTNQNFGLVKFHNNKIQLDGDEKEWEAKKIEPIFTSNKDSDHPMEKAYISHDLEYLYFGFKFKDINLEDLELLIFLDTIPNQGRKDNPFNSNISTSIESDFLVKISDIHNSKILVDSYYNAELIQEAPNFESISENHKNFTPILAPIQNFLTSDMGEIENNDSLNYFESGKLNFGSSNQDKEAYNSLSDYYIDYKNNFIELRIPWTLINFSDPSSKEIIGNIYKNGLDSRLNIDKLRFALAFYNKSDKSKYYSFPDNNKGHISSYAYYQWKEWNEVNISYTFKDSYYIIQELFSKY